MKLHSPTKLVRILASVLLAAVVGCGPTAQKKQSGMNAAASGAEKTASAETPSTATAAREDAAQRPVDPTTVDQAVLTLASAPMTVSAEKKLMLEQISALDQRLVVIGENLQGAMASVRAEDAECTRLTAEIRNQDGEIGAAIQNHPERKKALRDLEDAQAKLEAARVHGLQTKKNMAGNHSRDRKMPRAESCEECKTYERSTDGASVTHAQLTTRALDAATRNHSQAGMLLHKVPVRLKQEDEQIKKLLAIRVELQKRLDDRFAQLEPTASLLKELRVTSDKKHELIGKWKASVAGTTPSLSGSDTKDKTTTPES